MNKKVIGVILKYPEVLLIGHQHNGYASTLVVEAVVKRWLFVAGQNFMNLFVQILFEKSLVAPPYFLSRFGEPFVLMF